MRRDRRGFFYFVDRIGDSYRWKGENVSATEVGETLAAFPSVLDSVAFGVLVPHADGRAGMAVLVVRPDFNLGAFHAFLTQRLPPYAQPLFLRLCSHIEMTGTFKAKKQELARDGYRAPASGGSVFFNDRTRSRFVPLDDALNRLIETGKIRF